MTIWLDIETRSKVNLKANGLARYAQDPSTSLICISYAFDDGPVATWFGEDGPIPVELQLGLADKSQLIYAHNAQFERLLFDYVICADYDLPAIDLRRWRCSSARAMASGLPASLGDLCRALNLPQQKMSEGTRLIRDYCVLFGDGIPAWKEGDKELMQAYCEADVLTMRQACSVLRELEPYEWEQYHVTEIVNDRGVPVDVVFASAALKYAEEVRQDVNRQIAELTGGRVQKASQRKERDLWLTEKLTADQLKLITVTKNEVSKIKFDDEYRQLLAKCPDLAPEVDEFVSLVEAAGGSTISKYKSIASTHVDGRVHGSLVWSGAGATGRYSSRGLQLQNMRRDALDDPQTVIDDVIEGYAIDKPAETLGRLIRAVITSKEGLTFSDYAQIEARVLPWLSADLEAEGVLDIFREGRDLYTENAKRMFSVNEVSKDLRQAAKVAVLACGFGGGKNALASMAKMYGMTLGEEQAKQIVDKWRSANLWAVRLWDGLEQAARYAVRNPGTPFTYGRLKFLFDGGDWLWMQLPSGRCLAYYQPRFEQVTLPWGDESIELTCLWGSGKPKAGEKWPRRQLNRLILSENATQAAAADIMRETIVRAHNAGLPVLFSVHDELVVSGRCHDKLHEVMTTTPKWARGLPIDAETQESQRYGK